MTQPEPWWRARAVVMRRVAGVLGAVVIAVVAVVAAGAVGGGPAVRPVDETAATGAEMPLSGRGTPLVPAGVPEAASNPEPAGDPAPASPSATVRPVTPGKAAPATGTKKTPATSATPKAVTFSGIAGLGCTGAGTSYAHYGWYKNGNGGWWTLADGSTRAGGCDGRFDDMPMSGQSNVDTAGQDIVYGFSVGAGTRTCALSLYIPTSPSARDVVANPVHVAVMSGTAVDSPTTADRSISQADHHSSWLALGSFPVSGGALGVKLTNRGNPAGYSVTYPHIAGGAVQARCTA